MAARTGDRTGGRTGATAEEKTGDTGDLSLAVPSEQKVLRVRGDTGGLGVERNQSQSQVELHLAERGRE